MIERDNRQDLIKEYYEILREDTRMSVDDLILALEDIKRDLGNNLTVVLDDHSLCVVTERLKIKEESRVQVPKRHRKPRRHELR